MSSNLCDILARRKKILLLKKPPIRLELKNPYIDEYGNRTTDTEGVLLTKERFDMRRKAEILQYNKTSNVQGKLTRAQKYKQVIQGTGNRGSQTILSETGEFPEVISTGNCPDDLYLPTPSSSSDVPGPSISIKYDKKVPLYNYATNAQQLGVPNIALMEAWSFNAPTNILALSGVETSLLKIFHNIDNISAEIVNKKYTFTLNIPVGLYVAGDISNNIVTPNNVKSIASIDVNIYANDVYTPLVATITNINDIKDTSMNYTINSTDAFYATEYIGILNVTIPDLFIENLALYDIRVTVTNEHSEHDNVFQTLTGTSNNPVMGVYFNLTANNTTVSSNIDTTSVTSSTTVPGHTIFTIDATTNND